MQNNRKISIFETAIKYQKKIFSDIPLKKIHMPSGFAVSLETTNKQYQFKVK